MSAHVDVQVDELAFEIANSLFTGDDVTQPDEVRFLRGVAKVVQLITSRDSPHPPSGPSVFILNPGVEVDLSDYRQHRFIDKGKTPIDGRIWVTSPVVKSAHAREHVGIGIDALLDHVGADPLLVGQPCVAYAPEVDISTVHFFPDGVANPNSRIDVVIRDAAVTVEDVVAIIDRLHDRQLKTPDGQGKIGKLWKDARAGVPVAQVEETFQMYVETALNVQLYNCKIRREQGTVAGRLDLEVEQRDSITGALIRPVIIELKVVRSLNSKRNAQSPSSQRTWIEEGVDQAASYAEERDATEALLCCFDMRKEPDPSECLAHVREVAGQLGVHLRAWPIYCTAKSFRRSRRPHAADGG